MVRGSDAGRNYGKRGKKTPKGVGGFSLKTSESNMAKNQGRVGATGFM